MVCWHNYDCGLKNRIPRGFLSDGKLIDIVSRYCRCTPNILELGGKEYIHVKLDHNHATAIEIGDVVQFKGNRITVREDSPVSHRGYLYTTYQKWDHRGGFKHVKRHSY
ncbi:MAG: hypothetical protein NC311_06415 [Muribaculaceae bacterium]|nr:hypothetical protein [Muribaculaceae bacterium]